MTDQMDQALFDGTARDCMHCSKPVMVKEGVYTDDFDRDTLVHMSCLHAAIAAAASGNGPHPDDEHRLTKSEMGL
ncbi:MAG: hypothetical protein COB36_12290 [Alphaproteobacteria bacterium]|nr:MAG: hypothetical protein COB36_12290 [Alphaproteobacteria bacterium]